MNEDKAENTKKQDAEKQCDALSEEKQNKLLRLLGGKKAANAGAAAEWIHRSRTAEEEQSLKHGLEAQYNTSLNFRLSGKSRRHEGIGFENQDSDKINQSKDSSSKKDPTSDNKKDDVNENNKSRTTRDRSRSPLRKNEKELDNGSNRHSKKSSTDEVIDKSCAGSLTKPISKKNFYMQFTKSSSS